MIGSGIHLSLPLNLSSDGEIPLWEAKRLNRKEDFFQQDTQAVSRAAAAAVSAVSAAVNADDGKNK